VKDLYSSKVNGLISNVMFLPVRSVESSFERRDALEPEILDQEYQSIDD